jgi:predicted HAD superfamily Cof-like phosphohydrolase
MSGVLNWVLEWQKRVCPKPTHSKFNVALGCHFEEIAETLETLTSNSGAGIADIEAAEKAVAQLATSLKTGKYEVDIIDREGFLDAIADQVVTGVGAAYRAGMQPVEAITEVDCANWSKFDANGQPIFDAKGKVMKGANYKAPDLKGLF